jgi:hypothetical protein
VNVITDHRLSEGPLVFTPRGEKVAAMANVLIDARCWADADDCILALRVARRWKLVEVMEHLEDARAVATQYAVAMAMGAP